MCRKSRKNCSWHSRMGYVCSLHVKFIKSEPMGHAVEFTLEIVCAPLTF
jgi:hypothetical protein